MVRYIRRNLFNLKTDKHGLETLEYAIIAALFVAVGYAGYNTLFTAVSAKTTAIAANVTTP